MNERIWELAKKAGINLTPAQFSGVLEVEAVDGLHGPPVEVQVRGIQDPTLKCRKAMSNPISHFLVVG